MILPEFLQPDLSRKSGPALRMYMGFVFVLVSIAFTLELSVGGIMTGARIGVDGPMMWQPQIAGCRHCFGEWVNIPWWRYTLELAKFFVFIPVGAAFILVAYWHNWESRNDGN